MSMLLPLLLLLRIGGAPDEEGAALERYKQASQAKDEALLALEAAYARLETAFLQWRTAEAEHAPPLADRLAEVAAEAALAEALRRASQQGREARAGRRAEIEELERRFRQALEQRGLAEPMLRDGLAAAAAREAVGRSTAEEARPKLAALLWTWLAPERGFELLWNESLFARVEEARRYREQYDDYIAAGVELDRVRRPEDYLPGGAKTRPGMVYVPGGTYTVGPNVGFERRKRQVTLRPFLIDRHEVNQADYLTYLESLEPEQRLARTPRLWPIGPDGRARPPQDGLDHPVVGVTWRDADAYARFVGKRLPAEDEWEVACRGRDARPYPWGEEYAEGRCNDARLGLQTTVPVTRFEEGASPFRVFNMAGNVEEWTRSLEDGEVISELPSNIAAVVVRGGHYLSPPENVTALFRWVAPGGSTREPYVGFRCAADLQ